MNEQWIVAWNCTWGGRDFQLFETEEDARFYAESLEDKPYNVPPLDIFVGKVECG